MKVSFIWPRQYRVVYFGITGQSLLRTYIAEDDATIYVGPRTRLNIWVALTALVAGWWGIRGYYRAFLLLTRPTFVITLEDNALEFYLSKKYRPSCTTICIQNGRRDTQSLLHPQLQQHQAGSLQGSFRSSSPDRLGQHAKALINMPSTTSSIGRRVRTKISPK